MRDCHGGCFQTPGDIEEPIPSAFVKFVLSLNALRERLITKLPCGPWYLSTYKMPDSHGVGFQTPGDIEEPIPSAFVKFVRLHNALRENAN